MPEQNLTPEILAAALQGLEAQRARLDAHIAEVRRLLGARTHEPAAAAKAPRPRRRLSTAALKRIVEAQKKRWAEFHRKKAAAAAKAPRLKRRMSAAARKRIVEANRKRWAEYRRKQAEAAKISGVRFCSGMLVGEPQSDSTPGSGDHVTRSGGIVPVWTAVPRDQPCMVMSSGRTRRPFPKSHHTQ